MSSLWICLKNRDSVVVEKKHSEECRVLILLKLEVWAFVSVVGCRQQSFSVLYNSTILNGCVKTPREG